MANEWPDLVVGVDLGTTGTAVAYAKPLENKVHQLQNWPEGDRKYDKVPSMVAFEGNNLEAWGFGVMNLASESIPNLDTYKLFKPLLDSQNSLESLEAERCVRMFLTALYKYLQEALKNELPDKQPWHESKVKFLFSYPTTWSTNIQDRFSAQIKAAGYPASDDGGKILSLNEADASIVHFLTTASQLEMPRLGEHILVADIGGGTSDISIHKVQEIEGRAVKVSKVQCDEGKYVGSTQIDDGFKDKVRQKVRDIYQKRLQEQLGKLDENILRFYVDAALLHLEQNSTYMQQKHNYGKKEGKNIKLDFQLSLPDPPNPLAKDAKVDIETFIPISIDRKEFFEDFFHEQCSKIWAQCKDQMDKLEAGQTVKHVVLAGGLGCSAYVIARLSDEFEKYARSRKASPPRVIPLRDPQIAVCQGLVHDALRQIHGNSLWVYPATASYGIQKDGNKNDIKWFLKHGDALKVPSNVNIEHHVDLDQDRKAKPSEFQLVKIVKKPPRILFSSDYDRKEWNQLATPIQDISEWVQDSLKGDLKSRFPFSKKATFTINTKMLRDSISMTLGRADDKSSNTLSVLEDWHEIPVLRRGTRGKPEHKYRKFENLSDAIATVGVLAAIAGVIVAAMKLSRDPQPTASHGPSKNDQQPAEPAARDDGQGNIDSHDHVATASGW